MSPERDAVAAALCAVIAEALPFAHQNEKWNAPNFSVAGQDLITLNLPPTGPVRVVLHRGTRAVDTKTGDRLLDDDSGRLRWATDQRAVASFRTVEEVEQAADWLADVCVRWVDAVGG